MLNEKELILKKYKSLGEYLKMLDDPQIQTSASFRKYLIEKIEILARNISHDASHAVKFIFKNENK